MFFFLFCSAFSSFSWPSDIIALRSRNSKQLISAVTASCSFFSWSCFGHAYFAVATVVSVAGLLVGFDEPAAASESGTISGVSIEVLGVLKKCSAKVQL